MRKNDTPLRRVLLILLGLWLLAAPLAAAPHEEKIFIYFIYDQSNNDQRRFIDALYDKFKARGFRDFLKKSGIAWVEGNYNSLAGVLSFLDISRDDLIYFAVVTADKNDRLVREIVREKLAVAKGMSDRDIQALADNYSSKLYFKTEDTLDQFKTGSKWWRQNSLLNPDGEKAGSVSVTLDGKDVTKAFQAPPFKRAGISSAMVPYSPAFFKKLGIEATQTPWHAGSLIHLKQGKVRLDFYAGNEVQDRKIYVIDFSNGSDRRFISPTSSSFAYPESRGRSVFLPLRLIVSHLLPGLNYQEEGDHVTLTKK